jgi:hypothetical protein
MKIFFGGTLSGLENNKEDYLGIRKAILNSGHKITRDWIDEERVGVARSSSEMFELTEKAINESDAVILEYSRSVDSVGQQLTLALQRKMPVLLLVKDGAGSESDLLDDFFISSKHYKHLKIEKYLPKNINGIVTNYLQNLGGNKSIVRFNLEIERELDDYLKNKAKENRTSKSEEIRKLVLSDIKMTAK